MVPTSAFPKQHEPVEHDEDKRIDKPVQQNEDKSTDEPTSPALAAQPLCKKVLGLLHTKSECCNGDLLGLAHHGCAAPFPAPKNVTDFVNGYASIGKAAECCVSALVCENSVLFCPFFVAA